MATYSKLPKAIQDFALGYQSVNEESDSEHALRNAYSNEHKFLYGTMFGPSDHGRHNVVTVPRAIAVVKMTTVPSAGGGTGPTIPYFEVSSTRFIVSVSRLAVGTYFLATQNLHATDVWAEAHPLVNASAVFRRALTRYQQTSPAGTLGAGFMVYALERDASTTKFAPADFDFSLAVFSK